MNVPDTSPSSLYTAYDAAVTTARADAARYDADKAYAKYERKRVKLASNVAAATAAYHLAATAADEATAAARAADNHAIGGMIDYDGEYDHHAAARVMAYDDAARRARKYADRQFSRVMKTTTALASF